jgi:hypothetical protein
MTATARISVHIPAWACLAACLLMLGGCAQGINVGVRGGSASDVEWRIGLPF